MNQSKSSFRSPNLLVLVLMGCVGQRPVRSALSSPPPGMTASKSAAPAVSPPPVASSVPPIAPLSASALAYSETATRIREASLKSDGAFQKLSVLTDTIGPRLSGSASLERAVSWAKETFTKDGHEHVTLEPVRVPHWVRGAQAAEIVAPFAKLLPVLTLGGSVATPPAGISADVMVVSTFDELEARQAEVRGKIVLFDHAMAKTGDPGQNYGEAIAYRSTGAAHAARFGALAVLVRSLTAHSLGAPHTGAMRYLDTTERKIPAAAISVEDAELLHRLASRGEKLRVHLLLSPETLPDADSHNVSADLVGRELPQEVVLIGAHLDSWDVGQGAQDDGAGVVTMMQALTTLRSLGLRPRRTVRVVLFVNEENGARGAAQYEKDHRNERHVAAFEMDSGAGTPLGFTTDGEQPFLGEARELAALLAPIGASTVNPGFAGEDISALKPEGVPLFGVLLDIEHYFDVHHSAADTLDKIDPVNLQKAVAAIATMAFVIADRESSWKSGSAQVPPQH